MNRTLKKGFLACTLSALLLGCNSNNESANQLPVIDIAGAYNNITEVNLSEYASSIDYIPLETSPNSLVPGNITSMRIATSDDKVAIYTAYGSFKPLIFDKSGKFITSIGNQGRGADEYSTIFALFSNENGYELVTWNKILHYDKDGSYIRNAPTETDGSNFAKFPDGKYIYVKSMGNLNDSNQDVIVVEDESGNKCASKVVGKYEFEKPTAKELESVPEGSMLFTARTKKAPLLVNGREKPYIMVNERDTIYTSNQMAQLTPEYIINYGEYMPGLSWNIFFNESERFITSRALFNNRLHPNIKEGYRFIYFIYDKESGQTRGIKVNPVTESAGFTNDLDTGGIPFYPIAVKDGKMYQLISAIDFMDFAQQSTSQRMKEVAATLTEESNPVLIVVTLK